MVVLGLALGLQGPPPMKNIRSKSRRRTSWTDDKTATPLQAAIDSWNQRNYERRHPDITETGEVELLNSFTVLECKHCGSNRIVKYGKTNLGINRYRCKECGKTFTIITNTIFDNRKISISEWLDYLLDLFGFSSFTLASKGNRNSFNTTKYWTEKVFLVLRGCQDQIVLEDRVYLDETFFKVRKNDMQLKSNGRKYRGLSRNQICIGVACDGMHTICFDEGVGHASALSTRQAFLDHIEPGATLVHDGDQSHESLVKELGLVSEIYEAKKIKKLPDEENPLQPVNEKHRLLQEFLRDHSGFIRDQMQDFLNLFAFMMNPPDDKNKKVEKFLIMALNFNVLHRYRHKNDE